jgi:cysteine-rich repeat protein
VYARGAGGIDVAYAVADAVTVEATGGAPGRWRVFVDARTGAAIERRSELTYASGTVWFDVPDRAPLAAAGRHPQPASADLDRVNDLDVTSDAAGGVRWPGSADATVWPGLVGPYVAVTNQAGALITGALALANGGGAVWSRASDEAGDAQLDAFIYANQVKQFARARLDGGLAYLDRQLSVTVNDASGICNAYSTGDELHFFSRTPSTCENTGRIADVVYHEFGHSLHRHAIIPGVGQYDGALSEGIADTLAVALTGDSGVARGFFLDDNPLRELAPAIKRQWPRDLDGEVHHDGEIYGETMWDLRRALEAELGADAGFARFLAIYYATVQRAVDIPSSFAEALVADDDDGDLANGTPHGCAIIEAFAGHGLFDPEVVGGVPPPVRDGFTIHLAGGAPAMQAAVCDAPRVVSASLTWRVHGGDSHDLALAADGDGLTATIPSQRDGTIVEYRVRVALSSGAIQAFPSTPADPFYQFHAGPVTPLWCDDFETGGAGWTHSAEPAAADRWEVGAPSGLGGDPDAAYAGTGVLGLALTGDGRYLPDAVATAVSPRIALGGNTQVHVQYRRWLGVEDAAYDRATITVNGAPVWANAASAGEPGSAEVNLVDDEWRFQDLDVSRQAVSGSLQIAFGLASDAGLEAGGWTIDQLCVVAVGPSCGNGVVEADEACDDGNVTGGDGCGPACAVEAPAAPPGGGCGAGADPSAVSAGLLALAWIAARRRRVQRLPSLR